MVLAMLFFGGETLHYFALALTIGICFGIYSSVLVMAPLVRWLGTSRETWSNQKRNRRTRWKPREDPAVRQRRHGAAASLSRLRGHFMIAELLSFLLARRSPCGAGAGVAAAVLRRGHADHLRRDGPRWSCHCCRGFAVVHCRAITALAGLNVHLFVAILCAAAILGDAVNYFVGSRLGMKAFERRTRASSSRNICCRRRLLRKVRPFSIVMGRFVPIVRTFVPFLAGVAQMPYRTFFVYNVIGGAAWIASPDLRWLSVRQHRLGAQQPVRDRDRYRRDFSVLPIVIKVWQEHRRSKRSS